MRGARGLAIKTYLKMILLALVNHYWELGATRPAFILQQSNVRRLTPLLEHIKQHCCEPMRAALAATRSLPERT
jgi:hypothetical protein